MSCQVMCTELCLLSTAVNVMQKSTMQHNVYTATCILLPPYSTASEADITAGIFQLKADPNHRCLWSKRTFTDLLEQKPEDLALSQFCDLVAGRRGLEFDDEALKSLNHLKEARMPAKYIGYVAQRSIHM